MCRLGVPRKTVLVGAACVLAVLVGTLRSTGQADRKYTSLSNQQCLEILNQIQADLKEHYYDPRIRGFDLDERFETARREIAVSRSQDDALLSIYAAVAALRDSHTHFIPPIRPYSVEYGVVLQAVGDSDCYVTAVKPGSDAEEKGLAPGDQLLTLNGIKYTRADLRTAEYAYQQVVPQVGLHLRIRSAGGAERSLVVLGKVVPGQPFVRGIDVREFFRHYQPKNRSRYFSVEKKLLVWKLPDFVIDPDDVDGLLGKVRSYEALVLDLRGNPGGFTATLDKFIGGFFDHEVKVVDKKKRNGTEPDVAKSRGSKAFSGKLIVLIDSKSASASEIFARVVQLEKRGTVIGDRSAGAVAEGADYMHAVKLDATNVTQYGTSITIADLLMSDGKSLENEGVIPDERILGTASDLASGRDPVLARALELAGTKISPADAGKIFPFEWPKKLTVEFD